MNLAVVISYSGILAMTLLLLGIIIKHLEEKPINKKDVTDQIKAGFNLHKNLEPNFKLIPYQHKLILVLILSADHLLFNNLFV
jgi:hypothetical protein